MRELKAGERIDLPIGVHEIHFTAGDRFLNGSIGGIAVPVNANGELVSDFRPVVAKGGDSRPGLSWRDPAQVSFDPGLIPAAIDRLIFVLYLTDAAPRGATLAEAKVLGARIGGGLSFQIDMSGRDDTATILFEIYRRQDGWRVSANGQGFAFGISAVSRALKAQLPVTDAYSGARVDGPSGRTDDSDHPRPQPGALSSGSAFAIAPRLLLTNHHVIEDAGAITVSGVAGHGPAALVVADPVNDIALLRIQHEAAEIARFRPDLDVDLGEDVVVAGFPLQGLLGSGPQISGGNVSALTGIANNSGILQFNAPIGSGSSGGPILDCSGLVVGLVKAVLRDDPHHAQIAQNINFGVKAALVRSFLHAAGATPTFGELGKTRSRSEIARDARAYLYLVNVSH